MANKNQDMYKCIRSADGQVEKVVCKYCKQEFPGLTQIALHLRLHISKQLYICEKCENLFTKQSSLIRHTRSVHNGEKPYTCTICQKVFSQNGNLGVHMRMHTGVRPFTCEICQKTFTQSNNLTKHLNTVHKSESELN